MRPVLQARSPKTPAHGGVSRRWTHRGMRRALVVGTLLPVLVLLARASGLGKGRRGADAAGSNPGEALPHPVRDELLAASGRRERLLVGTVGQHNGGRASGAGDSRAGSRGMGLLEGRNIGARPGGGAAAAGGAAGGDTNGSSSGSSGGNSSGSSGEQLLSSVKVHATPNSKGRPNKYYYSFHDVRLTRGELQFFAPPGFVPPEDHWVDIITGNATRPNPPTMLAIKGEEKNVEWYYTAVKYQHASAGSAAQCRGWVEKPTYFLQVRYSHNIWHTWNEGLMGAFQTLREQGALPLVEVDADGHMREVAEGMGAGCPLIYDPALNSTRPDDSCPPKSGAVREGTCDPASQPWCRPGVWSYRRGDGPVILSYMPGSVQNPWAHIYYAMSEDVRDLSVLEGWCFRHLILGKTSTLNYYQANNATASPATQAARVEAMSVFKAFATAAQQEWVARHPASRAQFQGYRNANMERLRRGIGPEQASLADTILPVEVPLNLQDSPEELHRMWLWWRQEEVRALLEQEPSKEAKGSSTPSAGGPVPHGAGVGEAGAGGDLGFTWEAVSPRVPSDRLPLESPRPVVTYMSRHSFSRSILNEHELLRYILSRYNVTLRVTLFEEPLLEVMELLEHTDVLIGMHGAGWTNGMFVKHGAAAIQLYPYGWRLASGGAIRGFNYREIVLGNECQYREWYNPNPQHAFFREQDYIARVRKKYGVEPHLHPQPEEPHPSDSWPGMPWIYQNTYVDLASLGPVIDEAMASVGIPRMPQPPAAAQQEGQQQASAAAAAAAPPRAAGAGQAQAMDASQAQAADAGQAQASEGQQERPEAQVGGLQQARTEEQQQQQQAPELEAQQQSGEAQETSLVQRGDLQQDGSTQGAAAAVA